MRQAARAGLLYFLIAFTAGAALGSFRVLVLMPSFGAACAVLAELPLMLTVAWFACRMLTARLDVPDETIPRFVMGGLAFVLLISAEYLLALGLGRSLGSFVADLRTLPGLLGLGGQCLLAVLPVLQGDERRR